MEVPQMARGRLSKIDIESKVYRMKTALYNGHCEEKSEEWQDGYHAALNSLLEILQEYHT